MANGAEAAPKAGFVVATRGDRGSLLLARWGFIGVAARWQEELRGIGLGLQGVPLPTRCHFVDARSLHHFKCPWPLVGYLSPLLSGLRFAALGALKASTPWPVMPGPLPCFSPGI